MTQEKKDVKPNMAQPPATPVFTATTNWRASLTGSLEAYVLGENFDDYLERVNNYFELNGIPNEIYKIRLLLHLIGPVASTKITKACKPGNVTDIGYTLFVAKCKSLFKGEKNTIVEPTSLTIGDNKMANL